MTVQKFFTLNNGNKIPAVAIVGTGTRWFKTEETDATFSQVLVDQVKHALTLPGIVHIDAAEIYRTYPELGVALKEQSKPREELFITDKFSTALKLSETPIEALDSALKKLGLEYVDLYLLHTPFISEEKNGLTMEQAWKYMEELYKSGKAKNIGVSNFAKEHLERILAVAEVKPQVNQIEFSAFLQNQTPGIYNYAKEHNIQLEAYGPLGPLQKKPENGDSLPFYKLINELAEKYGKTEAQILLQWVYKRGVLPVTTSGKPARIEQAHDLFSFDLSKEDVDSITKLGLEHEPLRQYFGEEYNKYNSESQH